MNDLENEQIVKLIQTILFEMSAGNPGAISVLHQLFEKYPNELFDILEKMKKHNIIDYHIWVLYKDHNKNIDDFVKHIQNLE